jgi:hypothetical protein
MMRCPVNATTIHRARVRGKGRLFYESNPQDHHLGGFDEGGCGLSYS